MCLYLLSLSVASYLQRQYLLLRKQHVVLYLHYQSEPAIKLLLYTKRRSQILFLNVSFFTETDSDVHFLFKRQDGSALDSSKEIIPY